MSSKNSKLTALGLAGFAALSATIALAQLPMTNLAGITLVRESAETASYVGEQTNGAGVTLQLSMAMDASVDTTNPAGVTAFVGQLDPQPLQRNGAGVVWMLYDQGIGQ